MVKAPDEYPGRTYRGTLRYVYEHHLVWWQKTGSIAGAGLVVHHRNKNKRDNRIDNLELMTNAEHSRRHASARGRPRVDLKCPQCGSEFQIDASERRYKLKIGQVLFYCTRSCTVKSQWARGFPMGRKKSSSFSGSSTVRARPC